MFVRVGGWSAIFRSMTRCTLALVVAAVACVPERVVVGGDDDEATESSTASTDRDTLDADATTANGATMADDADGLPQPDVPGFACALPDATNADIDGYVPPHLPFTMRFAWYGNTGGGRCAPGHRVVITTDVDEFESSFYSAWQYEALKMDLVIGDPTAHVAHETKVYADAVTTVSAVGTVTARGGAAEDEPLVGSLSVDVEELRAAGDFVARHCSLLDAPPCP